MKEIPNFNNYYATTSGEIYSTKGISPRLMKQNLDTSKYYRIQLKVDGKAKSCLVHRLLAITFIPNPDNLPQVNHIDGNKLNNSLSNLEWCSHSHNQKHAYKTGLNSSVGESNNRSLLNEKVVIEIYNKLLDGARISELCKFYNVKSGTIGSIKDKTNWNYLLKDLEPIKLQVKAESLGESTIRWVCHKLVGKVPITSIVRECNNSNITINQVNDIKRRKTHTRISCEFDW